MCGLGFWVVLQGYLYYHLLRLLTYPDRRSCFWLLTTLQNCDLNIPNGHLWLGESFNKQMNVMAKENVWPYPRLD